MEILRHRALNPLCAIMLHVKYRTGGQCAGRTDSTVTVSAFRVPLTVTFWPASSRVSFHGLPRYRPSRRRRGRTSFCLLGTSVRIRRELSSDVCEAPHMESVSVPLNACCCANAALAPASVRENMAVAFVLSFIFDYSLSLKFLIKRLCNRKGPTASRQQLQPAPFYEHQF